MNAELIATITEAVVGVITLLITAYLIPWLKTKITAEKQQEFYSWVEYAVKAARQIYPDTPENNAKKKEFVSNFIVDIAARLGLKFTMDEINTIIEGIYNGVKEGSNVH